jgi:hypothetical protein
MENNNEQQLTNNIQPVLNKAGVSSSAVDWESVEDAVCDDGGYEAVKMQRGAEYDEMRIMLCTCGAWGYDGNGYVVQFDECSCGVE